MKTRESGMPEEEMWEGFFNPIETLEKLGLTPEVRDLADFGCGYGTFALAAAHAARALHDHPAQTGTVPGLGRRCRLSPAAPGDR